VRAFRDIGSAVVGGLQFVFFLTPIIWTEDSVRGTAFSWLTRVNPFATLLDLVRRPLLSQPIDAEQWLLGLVYAIVVAAIGLGCYAHTAVASRIGCDARMSKAAHIVLRDVSVTFPGPFVSRPFAAQSLRRRRDAAPGRRQPRTSSRP
jgi:hypothetical protein